MKKFCGTRVLGLPLPLYLAILAITAACVFLDALPDNIVGAMLLLMTVGEGLHLLGSTVPIVKTYLGGSVLCIFGGALLAFSGVIPEHTMATAGHFVSEQGFLVLYISSIITGSLFRIDRRLLLRGSARLLPVGLLAIFLGCLVCGLAGLLSGNGFWDNILYIALPMTSGGMSVGSVPLSEAYAAALNLPAGELLTRMTPATILGNCLAIIFAGLLNNLGKRLPSITGNGQLVNDGRPPEKTDPGAPTPASMAAGLLTAIGFYCLAYLLHSFVPAIPVYAWMVGAVVFVKSLRLLPAGLEAAACHWGDFAVRAWTAAALFGLGLTMIDLAAILRQMTPGFFLTVLLVEAVITATAAFFGRFAGFYPLESAICGMCSTNMGGSGNVAVLSGAHRMELLPFAQIVTRVCGAVMLTLGGLLIRIVG